MPEATRISTRSRTCPKCSKLAPMPRSTSRAGGVTDPISLRTSRRSAASTGVTSTRIASHRSRGGCRIPARADEVVVNEETARRYGYHVGQRVDFGVVSRDDVENPDPALLQDPKPRLLVHATIVGVGAFIEEVAQDDTDRSTLVLFTPAFVREAKGLELYAWQGLVLRNGDADVAGVKQTINAQSGGGPQIFRVTSTDTFHAVQATRPVSLALGVFGIIVGLAGLVLVSQALARHLRGRREDQETARALGADPNLIARASVIAPAIAILGGVLLAVIGAVLASPAMPIGPVRRVEVDVRLRRRLDGARPRARWSRRSPCSRPSVSWRGTRPTGRGPPPRTARTRGGASSRARRPFLRRQQLVSASRRRPVRVRPRRRCGR